MPLLDASRSILVVIDFQGKLVHMVHRPAPVLEVARRLLRLADLFGVPVVLDCTHSLQQPNQSSGVTGGRPALIETIARAGIATGADGLFIETHPRPSEAKSDGANMLPLSELERILEGLVRIREAIA